MKKLTSNGGVRIALSKIPLGWGLLIGVGLIGVVVIASFKDASEFPLSSVIQTEVLWFTAIAIVGYTMEAYLLRKTAEQTREAEIRPYLRLRLSSDANQIFELTNVGKGVAIAVHLENFQPIKSDVRSLSFKGVSAIAPNETHVLTTRTPVTDIPSLKLEIENSIRAETFPNLFVSYHDLANWIYKAKFRPRDDYDKGFSILGPQVRARKIKNHEA